MTRIILASQSPRRKMLLEWAEIDFEVMSKHTEEIIPEGASKEDIPIIIAKEKALAVKHELTKWAEGREDASNHLPILAADTIVVLDDVIIGKPENREEAIQFLQMLSGKKHKVITGVYILAPHKEMGFLDTTEVEFYPLQLDQIEYYVDKYEPYDKAGAYAIQEWIGVVGIKCINGDFYNVMGLPVSRVLHAVGLL
jgi:septum formation protein